MPGHRTSAALVCLLLNVAAACGQAGPGRVIRITSYPRHVRADDGFVLSAYDLHLEDHPRDEQPRAWLFHIVGSEPVSIVGSMEQYADIIAQGFVVVLLQPRGVKTPKDIDLQIFRQYETRQRRVADQAAVLSAYLDAAAPAPVLLVGSSQGGTVAAELATQDPRVTHLLMMASGGGWTQAQEMTYFLEHGQHIPDVANADELNAKFDQIRGDPDGDTLWYGHPFRMWSSYLWFRAADGLTALTIPMLLAQGTADRATPVDSARALRDEFDRLGLTNLTYAEYPGLDHHFNDDAGNNGLAALQADASAWMMASGLVSSDK